jgi:hypothetical protein
MAFKLQPTPSQTNIVGKKYLFPMVEAGVGPRIWCYVTADTPATLEISGYITAATNKDHAEAVANLRVGDLIYVYRVAAATDTRNLNADFAAGITSISLHVVVTNTGALVDLSPDLLAGTLTYTTAG